MPLTGWPKLTEVAEHPDNYPELVRTFRAALFESNDDLEALLWLAKAWHFFDPDIETEEARIKRKCFIELLIYSGVWLPEHRETVFRKLVNATGATWKERAGKWLRSLAGLRLPTKKENPPQ